MRDIKEIIESTYCDLRDAGYSKESAAYQAWKVARLEDPTLPSNWIIDPIGSGHFCSPLGQVVGVPYCDRFDVTSVNYTIVAVIQALENDYLTRPTDNGHVADVTP